MTTTYPKAKSWLNPRLEQVTALKAKNEEFEAEAARLLERAQRAEARVADLLEKVQVVANNPDRMSCGPSLELDDDLLLGPAHIAWCNEVARVERNLASLHGHDEEINLPCGHPRGCIVRIYGGAAICAWCHEVTQLQEKLEQAEIETREAVAREAVLIEAGRALSNLAMAQGKEPNLILDPQDLAEFDSVIENVSLVAAALLERLAELETQVADLRAALQAALLPLERAADALVPEARVAEAAGLVDEALVAIREELE